MSVSYGEYINNTELVFSKNNNGYKVAGLDANQLLNNSIDSFAGGGKQLSSIFLDLAAPIPYLYHSNCTIPSFAIHSKYINTDKAIDSDIYDKLLDLVTNKEVSNCNPLSKNINKQKKNNITKSKKMLSAKITRKHK